ncbi:MAG: hypothetical protein JNK53_05170 [Phycisphaerae bacterium]|nr:hypothetical protein [Phycisphaerae bacterium]
MMPDIAVFAQICQVPEDLNGDGVVNGADLGVILAAWGTSFGSPADLNHDGAVDGADLAILLAAWGQHL